MPRLAHVVQAGLDQILSSHVNCSDPTRLDEEAGAPHQLLDREETRPYCGGVGGHLLVDLERAITREVPVELFVDVAGVAEEARWADFGDPGGGLGGLGFLLHDTSQPVATVALRGGLRHRNPLSIGLCDSSV